MNGENPVSLTQVHHNDDFTLVSGGGATEGQFWRISNGQYKLDSFTTNDLTALVSFRYDSTPADTTTLLTLRNASHKITVQSTGSATSLRIIGGSTVILTDLDLTMSEEDPVSTILRITLDSSGNAKVYVYESMEDEMGEDAFTSLTGASDSTGRLFQFGNGAGSIDWGTVYFTHHGIFNPDELAQSALYQMVLNRLGLKIRQLLRDSPRMSLKEVMDDSIIYGYDLSSEMVIRLRPPTIHIIVSDALSPEFNTLGGTHVDNEMTVNISVTTKGRDYREAYRYGLRIIGDVFDELYTGSGHDLGNNVDMLSGYRLTLDPKIDPDEQVCIHQLELSYVRREKMLFR